MYSRKYQSSFPGKIDEFPGIFVDNFENADKKEARAYFLSHCHTDHIQGLFTRTLIDALELSGALLYMSEPTAIIIADETSDKSIVKYIRPLKLGTVSITLPANNFHTQEEIIRVSLIPAGHSFGSVMFLFRTTTKSVLFTGDFRMSSNDLPRYGHFHNDSKPITIDAMYVDTTFITNKYLDFPKRSESIEHMIEVVREWLSDKGNALAIHTSAKYGYEYVFNDIHKKLDLPVYVDQNRWQLYSKLQHLVHGVINDERCTRIHICQNRSETSPHDRCLPDSSKYHKYLFVHLSAMKWSGFEVEDTGVNQVSETRLDVCFATHCSRRELLYFVNYFYPKKVVGFPNEFPRECLESPGKTDLQSNANKRKITPLKRKVANKESANLKKVDRNVIQKIFEI